MGYNIWMTFMPIGGCWRIIGFGFKRIICNWCEHRHQHQLHFECQGRRCCDSGKYMSMLYPWICLCNHEFRIVAVTNWARHLHLQALNFPQMDVSVSVFILLVTSMKLNMYTQLLLDDITSLLRKLTPIHRTRLAKSSSIEPFRIRDPLGMMKEHGRASSFFLFTSFHVSASGVCSNCVFTRSAPDFFYNHHRDYYTYPVLLLVSLPHFVSPPPNKPNSSLIMISGFIS